MQTRHLATANRPQSRPPTLLITAFRAFKGRPVNGSSTILDWLRRKISAPSHHFYVLPVDWTGAPARLRQILERLQPQLILHLGEGKPERIAFERAAHNETLGIDESGKYSWGEIETNGPVLRRSTLRFDSRWFRSHPIPVVASDDAGRFLCNRILYESLRHRRVRTGFLHLPPQGETACRQYVREIGPVVVGTLERNLMIRS